MTDALRDRVGHTPGAWRLTAGNATEVMAGLTPVARARCGGMTGIRLAEAEANARLIAAAPDLLAALIRASGILADFSHACSVSETEGDEDPDVQALEIVRAAITRATGAA